MAFLIRLQHVAGISVRRSTSVCHKYPQLAASADFLPFFFFFFFMFLVLFLLGERESIEGTTAFLSNRHDLEGRLETPRKFNSVVSGRAEPGKFENAVP